MKDSAQVAKRQRMDLAVAAFSLNREQKKDLDTNHICAPPRIQSKYI